MKGPLPALQRVSVCFALVSLSLARLLFPCLLPPTEQEPFLHKDPPSPLYIIQPSYLGWNPRLCVKCAPHPSWLRRFLLLCQCSHNAELKSSGPSLLMSRGPLLRGVMEKKQTWFA